MPTQASLDRVFLNTAHEIASLSHSQRKRVGSIIVKDGNILSMGYNGTPSGFDNCCEVMIDGDLVTKPEVLHAEANAITKMAKSTQSCDGATLYQTLSPCLECCKLIIQSGIKRVVFSEIYRKCDGFSILEDKGVQYQFMRWNTELEKYEDDTEYLRMQIENEKQTS